LYLCLRVPLDINLSIVEKFKEEISEGHLMECCNATYYRKWKTERKK